LDAFLKNNSPDKRQRTRYLEDDYGSPIPDLFHWVKEKKLGWR
jgi:hypothetical protein